MAALHDLPGFPLRLVLFGPVVRMVANSGRVKQDLGAAQRGEPCALGKPLVPADEHPNPRVAGVEGAKSEVAGGKVELLVIERVIRDMHLAVLAEERPVGIDDNRGVMKNPLCSFLKYGHDQDDPMGSGELAQALGGRSGDGLGQSELLNVFALAEIA